MNSIELSPTTREVISKVRFNRPEWSRETDDYVIFMVFTEYLAKQGEQSLNEWLDGFF